jgi:hypothetical protein
MRRAAKEHIGPGWWALRSVGAIGVLAVLTLVAQRVTGDAPEDRAAGREVQEASRMEGCPAYPAMPDARCTGWQHTGVTLRSYTGPSTITAPGTVIDGKDIVGDLNIQADDVKVTRSRVRGHITTGDGDNSGIVIQDVEVNPGNVNGSRAAIGSSGFTCLRCNVYNAGQGFNITGDVTIRDSYVHDLFGQGTSHNEPVISNGGGPFTIVHNELVAKFNPATTGGAMSASLALYGDFRPIRDVLVQNNRFNLANGGSYCVYAGSVPGKAHPTASNTRFVDNRFARTQSQCGQYGPVDSYDGVNGNAWTGNVWDDTGKVMSPPEGPG